MVQLCIPPSPSFQSLMLPSLIKLYPVTSGVQVGWRKLLKSFKSSPIPSLSALSCHSSFSCFVWAILSVQALCGLWASAPGTDCSSLAAGCQPEGPWGCSAPALVYVQTSIDLVLFVLHVGPIHCAANSYFHRASFSYFLYLWRIIIA